MAETTEREFGPNCNPDTKHTHTHTPQSLGQLFAFKMKLHNLLFIVPTIFASKTFLDPPEKILMSQEETPFSSLVSDHQEWGWGFWSRQERISHNESSVGGIKGPWWKSGCSYMVKLHHSHSWTVLLDGKIQCESRDSNRGFSRPKKLNLAKMWCVRPECSPPLKRHINPVSPLSLQPSPKQNMSTFAQVWL